MIPNFQRKVDQLHQELATEVQRYGEDFSDLIIRMVTEDYHTTAAEVLEVWIQSEADAKDREGGA